MTILRWLVLLACTDMCRRCLASGRVLGCLSRRIKYNDATTGEIIFLSLHENSQLYFIKLLPFAIFHYLSPMIRFWLVIKYAFVRFSDSMHQHVSYYSNYIKNLVWSLFVSKYPNSLHNFQVYSFLLRLLVAYTVSVERILALLT